MNEGANTIGLACREKLWTERDASEKLEALRAELIRLSHLTSNLVDQVYKLVEHQHAPNGQVLGPIGERGSIGKPLGYQYRVPVSLRDKELL